MTPNLTLLPAPQRVAYQSGQFTLPASALLLLSAPQPQALMPAAQRLLAALATTANLHWDLTASAAVPADQIAITLRVAPERVPQPQGYRLHVTPAGVMIEGHDPAGVFYGAVTLIQLVEAAGAALPCLEIVDWPDIAARGVMIDISRDKVYTMETLYELVDRLAGWKINQVQLYTEHTFAYRQYPEVWAKASPMTGAEIMALDAYCQERFIELVPNQNSFGHMERWLPHPRLRHLAETHEEFHTPWGNVMKGPFSLAPEHPGSIELIKSMYDELLPHFSSKMFNVGCDETIDLGQGVSKAVCAERGPGRVYLDYLLKIYADVSRRGYTMQFWGDIIKQHPELVGELPRDTIALAWGYDADHPFDREGAQFADSGVPFYVCPGTSSWATLAGRTDNCLENLVNAAENGLKHGAIGYLNTDWGDAGHWQAPPISYLGFAAGAGLSWSLEANRSADWAAVTGRFAFEDSAGVMGRLAYDLGNAYKQMNIIPPNGSALFWILQYPLDQVAGYGGANSAEMVASLHRTLEYIDAAAAPLAQARMARPDADLIAREFNNTARALRHACHRALFAIGDSAAPAPAALRTDLEEFIAEYRALWLARARPGGLDDSAGRFQVRLAEYC